MEENISTPILYHYCTVETFLNIIKYKTIRLSDILHMNDPLEIKYGKEILFDIMGQDQASNFSDIEMAFYSNFNNTYISCFSESGDLLSQWRGYGDNAKGVSIGFNFEKGSIKKGYPYQHVCLGESIGLEKVIYKSEKQIMEIEEANLKSGEIDSQVKLAHIGICIPFFKKDSYVEEKEWRIVYNALCNHNHRKNDANTQIISEISFREKEGKITSHYDYSFENNKEIISEIIIGPKCKIEIDDLKFMLSKSGFDISKIQIKYSSIMYR